MAGRLNAIYDRLPRIGQTFALNCYGLKTLLRKRRWNCLLTGFQASEHWSKNQRYRYVDAQLRKVLGSAVTQVPRYASLAWILPHLADPKSDIFAILNEFPIIARDEVLADETAFITKSLPSRGLVRTRTSGTTGTPFTTWMDRTTFAVSDALAWRRTLWAGYRPGDWIARIVGDPVVPLGPAIPPRPFRISWTDRRLYLSGYHLSRDSAMDYFAVLEKRAPAFLMGYPSTLEILAAFALERDRRPKWRPKAVLYSSEPIYDHQRALIEQVFGVTLRGYYGSAERVISAAQCEHGAYHLSVIDGYLEGQDGFTPDSGQGLVTTLLNRVMPLIRFKLGDDLRCLRPDTCPCGRTLPMIAPVITKQEDWIETPSGKRLSPSIITWAFKDIKGLRRTQIVQTAKGRVEVHMDMAEDDFDSARNLVDQRLQQMFFNEVTVQAVLNQQIQITSAGKTRFVVVR